MSTAPPQLSVVRVAPPTTTSHRPPRDAGWQRAARQARWLAWASLLWMTLEGLAGLMAGLQANSISVLTWAASSAVEGLASAIVIWRFTGDRTLARFQVALQVPALWSERDRSQ